MEEQTKNAHQNWTVGSTTFSPKVDKLFEAMSKFQQKCPPLQRNKSKIIKGKSKSGKTYSRELKYADLAEVINHCSRYWTAEGLALSQEVSNGEVITIVGHKSGQFKITRTGLKNVSLQGNANAAQEAGASITYARRYALEGALGVAASADDDADSASSSSSFARQQEQKPKYTQDELRDLQNELLDLIQGQPDENQVGNWLKGQQSGDSIKSAIKRQQLKNELREEAKAAGKVEEAEAWLSETKRSNQDIAEAIDKFSNTK